MNAFPSKFLSDNPKPVLSHAEGLAIEDLYGVISKYRKWLELSVIAFLFLVAVAVGVSFSPSESGSLSLPANTGYRRYTHARSKSMTWPYVLRRRLR